MSRVNPRRHRPSALAALLVGALLLTGCSADSTGDSSGDDAAPGAGEAPSSQSPPGKKGPGKGSGKGSDGPVGPGTGDLLVRGTLLDGGQPVTDGQVLVTVMSTGEVGAGEEVPTWESQPVRTDKKGRWEVEVDPGELESQFLPEDQDHLDFDLRVSRGDVWAMWATTAWLLDEPQVWRTKGAGPGDGVLTMDIDLGKDQIAVTDSTGETQRQEIWVVRPEA